MYVTPVVAGDLVFAGSCSGTYYALDFETGEERWSYDTVADGGPSQFHGDPVVTEDLVVTGSDSGDPPYMYAFERATGAVRWKREGAALQSDLVRVGSNVIGRTWNGDLVSVELETGEISWKLRPDDYLYEFGPDESLLERNGVVYLGGVDGKMYAVHAKSGATIWKLDLGSRVTTAPVASETSLFVGVADNEIYRLALADGEIETRITTEGRPHGRPAVVGNTLIVLTGRKLLVAYDTDLQNARWTQTAGEQWTSFQPLIHDAAVVVGNRDGEVYAYRIEDGEEAWRTKVEGMVRGLGARGRTLFIGTLSGTLYAYRLAEE